MEFLTLVLGLLLFLGGFSYLVYFERLFVKDRLKVSLAKKDWMIYGGSIASLALGLLLCGLSLFLFNPSWGGDQRGKYLAIFTIGLFLFGIFASTLVSGFVFHYYKPKMEANTKKIFTYFLFGSIPLAFFSFLLFMEGIAPFQTYPLVSGFAIGSNGFYWTSAANRAKSGDFHIAFYGIIILFGVCVSYWVCDHKFYQKFHKHGILDSLVLWAFPAGIIGARIWYVVGNWDREFASGGSNPFAIWDGGLTILGGAFAGIVVGFLFLRIRRKYVDPRWAVDICLPSILLAQVIGRWGNFFNNEVYGATVDLASGWSWLPTWISSQMHFDGYNFAFLAPGKINVPLFLIEGLLNLAGYFIIVYGVGKGLKKFLVPGDLGAGYFIWYGTVRIIMEPMRNSAFNMGADNSWSISNSLIYILLGLAISSILHIHDYCLKNKDKNGIISLGAAFIGFLGLVFPVFKSLTAGSTGGNNAKTLAVYTGFEVLGGGTAPLLVTGYILVGLGALGAVVSFILSRLKKEKPTQIAIGISALLSLVGSLIFFFGKNSSGLPSSISGESATYSLSYGFVLIAFFALWSFLLSASSFWVKLDQKKLEESNV